MRHYIAILIIFFLFSCNSKLERINDATDIEFGEKLTLNFYDQLSQKSYEKILKIADDSLDKNELRKVFVVKDSVFGKLLKVDIKEVKTTIRTNSDKESYSEYITATVVKYEKGVTNEIVAFVKNNSDNIKLKVYTVEQE